MLRRLRSIASFLASYEIWPVALLVVAGIVSARVLPLAIVVAALFWPIRWLAYGKLTVRTPVDWPIALLVLMIPVTLWATALPDITNPLAYRLLTSIALYYAIVNWSTTRSQFELLLAGTLMAGIGLALTAPLSVEWIVDKFVFIPPSLYNRFSLLVSDTIHPNVMAGQLIILLPPALALPLFAWPQLDRLQRILIAMSALVISSILLLSQSRGALMALGAILLMLTVLRWRRAWLLLTASAMIGVIVIQLLGTGTILEMVRANLTFRGTNGRTELWSRALYMIQDFPFTGVGMGLYTDMAEVFYPFFLVTRSAAPHAHNLFLQVAVDLGIPGLVAWLAILILMINSGWQIYQHGRIKGDKWVIGIGAGLLCSQVGLIVHGLVDAVTSTMARPVPIVWGMWGLTIAAWRVLVVKSGE